MGAKDWSGDGRLIAVQTWGGETRMDVRIVDVTGETEPTVALASPFFEQDPTFSPDGRWLAYASDESGRDEVYVRSYPGTEGKWQVSVAGGSEPRWSPDGRELLYTSEDLSLMAVDVTPGEGFRAGVPQLLFEARGPQHGGSVFSVSRWRAFVVGRFSRGCRSAAFHRRDELGRAARGALMPKARSVWQGSLSGTREQSWHRPS